MDRCVVGCKKQKEHLDCGGPGHPDRGFELDRMCVCMCVFFFCFFAFFIIIIFAATLARAGMS